MEYNLDLTQFDVQLQENIELLKDWGALRRFMSQETWMKGFAACKYLLYKEEKLEDAYAIYVALMDGANYMISSTYLTQEDYKLWFGEVKKLHEAFITADKVIGYAFMFNLLTTARYGYRDIEQGVIYLKEGVKQGDLESKALLGYTTWSGLGEIVRDEEESVKILDACIKEGSLNAKLFKLQIAFRNSLDFELLEEVALAYKDFIIAEGKGLYVLGEYYLKKGEIDKAVGYLEEGVSNGSGLSAYILGSLACAEKLTSNGYDLEKGLMLYGMAFSRGVSFAGYLEGSFYHEQYFKDMQQPERFIKLLELAGDYYCIEALELLGRTFLNDDVLMDVDRGFGYLEKAIEMGSATAWTEKGMAYLNGVVTVDGKQARICFEKGLALGDMYAAYNLGYGWQHDLFEEGVDYNAALRNFEKAVDGGYVEALEYVANYYRNGYHGEIDKDKAIALFSRGAQEYNSDFSKVELASMLIYGEGVERNVEEAEALLLNAYENGYSYAGIRLGMLYEDGLLGEVDLESARAYFLEAAEEGRHAEGLYHYARFLRYGLGGEQDEVESFDIFMQALGLGYVDAYVDVALAYEEGSYGGEPNPQLAFENMEHAASAGIGYAQYKLGYYYTNGYHVLEDKEKGREWLEIAVETGSPLAMLLLGDYYLYHFLPEEDPSKAFQYYKLAEELDYISEGIGVCYQFGIGVEQDEEQSFSYYKIAAQNGYHEAAFRVGQCLYWGVGTPEDRRQSFEYLKYVADFGYGEAAFYVGEMLLKGEYVEKDIEVGVSFLIQAADSQIHQAQLELGNCYLMGIGVQQDDHQALYWYQCAAENGNEEAEKIVGKPRKRKK